MRRAQSSARSLSLCSSPGSWPPMVCHSPTGSPPTLLVLSTVRSGWEVSRRLVAMPQPAWAKGESEKKTEPS
eukprot:13390230-Heterocapsa_arctica.AAC.1